MDELFNLPQANTDIINGVVIGLVVDNKDPDNLARIKVQYPVLNSNFESNWVRMVMFMAGKNRGGYFLPEVGDEVLVAFMFGNINTPFVLGALYNGIDTPPQNNADGENNIREIRSRSGHVIRFDDQSSAEKIEIIDKTGNNKIIIDSSSNSINIDSKQDISLSAPEGKISLSAQNIELNGSSSVSAKGGQVKLNADSSLSTQSGSTTNIKAGATVSVSGVAINLN